MALTALTFKRNIAASTAAGYTTGANANAIVFANGDNSYLRSLWMGGNLYGVGELMTSTKLGLGKLYSDSVQSVAANSVSAVSGRTYGVQRNANGQLVVNVPWVNTTSSASTTAPGIYKIATSIPHGSSSDNYVPTQKAVDDALDDIQSHIPSIMVFKGTIGEDGTVTVLPPSPKPGDTYKVITADTYGSITAKVGDMIVYSKPEGSTGSWVLIPSGDEADDTWRPVYIGNVQIVGSGTSTGSLGFDAGAGTEVTYDSTTKIISVGHSNSITAGSLTPGTRTYAAGLKIGSIVTTGATFDAQGHITSKGSASDLYVPIATASTLGVVKCGYTTSGKNYAVQVDTNGNLFVQVEWTDTHYTSRTVMSSGSEGKTNIDGICTTYPGSDDRYDCNSPLYLNHVEGPGDSTDVVTSYEKFEAAGAVQILAEGDDSSGSSSLKKAGTITFGTYWDE